MGEAEAPDVERAYWDALAGEWGRTRPHALWRAHSDRVNAALLARWLPEGLVGRALKTDVFDEAWSEGLSPMLAARVGQVVGIDLSVRTQAMALGRHPELRGVVADVRRLPFADGAFDVVVSNSTLDHFPSFAEVVVALGELRRVARPGGQVLLTLDNRANPVVALRNALPFGPLRRLGVVPYYVGATCGPRRLRTALAEAGFEAGEVEAVMHCPRAPAVALAGYLEARGTPAARQRYLRLMMGFERLAGWPTRFLTGYFVAARATRPAASLEMERS